MIELTCAKIREIQYAWPDGNRHDALRTTDEHLFWEDRQGWVEAQQLKVGDWLVDESARRVRVTGNQRLDGPLPMYTLRLREDPAFYANGVLVHDLCGWWTPEVAAATPTRGPPAPTPASQPTVKSK